MTHDQLTGALRQAHVAGVQAGDLPDPQPGAQQQDHDRPIATGAKTIALALDRVQLLTRQSPRRRRVDLDARDTRRRQSAGVKQRRRGREREVHRRRRQATVDQPPTPITQHRPAIILPVDREERLELATVGQMSDELAHPAPIAGAGSSGERLTTEPTLVVRENPIGLHATARWDMIKRPPDILVTNYSMLNVMLMRECETPLFERTASWLRADPARAFTLVVDELHTYRGTQGSEVALVIRSFLRHIGLRPGSDQLRCVGTSASLDPDSGRGYREEFFGVPRATFFITAGTPRAIEHSSPLDPSRLAALADLPDNETAEPELAGEAADQRLDLAFTHACTTDGATRATPLDEIAVRLLGRDGTPAALSGALRALAIPRSDAAPDPVPLAPLRPHDPGRMGMQRSRVPSG